jgi:hypothetical protein
MASAAEVRFSTPRGQSSLSSAGFAADDWKEVPQVLKRLANEGAQRYDQFLGMHEPARGKLVRRTRCQPDLFVRAEQDDVG